MKRPPLGITEGCGWGCCSRMNPLRKKQKPRFEPGLLSCRCEAVLPAVHGFSVDERTLEAEWRARRVRERAILVAALASLVRIGVEQVVDADGERLRSEKHKDEIQS